MEQELIKLEFLKGDEEWSTAVHKKSCEIRIIGIYGEFKDRENFQASIIVLNLLLT